ncbi:MAG: YidC/Oxa1 family membrane protein insertase, partial [Clostridia bacterium]|nr:YidC/Oxa1 family membrane protein insertase [Clostridia bacterium]
LLETPWGEKGFGGITILWLIPLFSGLTALCSSILSTYYSKQGMSREKQPGQGCSNFMLLGFMPLFSLYITFTVPGGVGIYWTCSNVIAIIQTVILNSIYNPKKIREQAEIDYEERRRLRAEMKKKQQTLADARRLDDEAERAADEAAAKAAEEAKDPANKGKKKEKKLNLEMGQIKKDENE